MAKRRSQKGLEFRRQHLAAAHRKITVLSGSEPRDMVGDRNVPGRIRKDHLGPLVSEKSGIALGHQGICTEDAMFAEQPEVSRLRHRRRGLVHRRQIVLFVAAGTFEATSISPISKPLMRRSISPLISIMSENSSLRASNPSASPR